MTQETQYQLESKEFISFNNGYMSRGVYNLIISIRDVKLYSKGIRPHRSWKIGDVKRYFGIKGNVIKIVEQLEQVYREHILTEQIYRENILTKIETEDENITKV